MGEVVQKPPPPFPICDAVLVLIAVRKVDGLWRSRG